MSSTNALYSYNKTKVRERNKSALWVQVLRHFKDEVNLKNIQSFSSYRTVNTLRLVYKTSHFCRGKYV
jgi:hypothetical protein